jgi:hypothetical protein
MTRQGTQGGAWSSTGFRGVLTDLCGKVDHRLGVRRHHQWIKRVNFVVTCLGAGVLTVRFGLLVALCLSMLFQLAVSAVYSRWLTCRMRKSGEVGCIGW